MLRGLATLFLVKTGILRLVGGLLFDGRVPLAAKAVVLAALLYVVSPLDLVPDLLPLAGWIDDLIVLVASLAYFIGSIPREVIAEHIGRGKRGRDGTGPVVEGKYRVMNEDEERVS